MESISEGLGDQSVYLALDWATLKAAEEDDPSFSDDDEPGSNNDNTGDKDDGSGQGGLTGGSGLGNSTLPGGSSLGGSSIGGNSLKSGSLGGSSLGGSSLKSASGVKTDDTSSNSGLWIAVLAAGCICLGAGVLTTVRSGRRKRKQDREQRREK